MSFERPLKSVVREVAKSDGQIIPLHDELHTIVGGASRSADAGNILKPALKPGGEPVQLVLIR